MHHLTVISLVLLGSATDKFILEVALYKCQIVIKCKTLESDTQGYFKPQVRNLALI